MRPRLPPNEYWFICYFFLLGPGFLHKIKVSAFSCRPSGRVRNNSNIFLQPPVCHISCSDLSQCLLPLGFSFLLSFLLLLSLTGESFLWTVPLLGLLNPCTFSRLRYLIIFHLAIIKSCLLQSYQLWLTTSSLALSFTFTAISTCRLSHCFQKDAFRVLLLVL